MNSRQRKRRTLLAEVKRRKVVRTAVVYGAGAFALLQAADIILPRLGVPETTMTVLVVLALLGAPLAIVLSWAFDLTADGLVPAGRTRETTPHAPPPPLLGRRTAIVAVALVLLGIGLGAGWFLKPTAATATHGESALAGSIAVLPFAHPGGDAENEWFADGLTEEVLNRLARMPGLRVAGRTSSFHFKGHEEDLRTIGARLGVAHLLEGSVRRAGQRLRVTVQLVKADDGLHLWSDSYDRQLDDVFAIQDEIARAIAAALEIELGAGVTNGTARTTSLPAYERYIEAQTLIARRGDAAIARALALLEDAVRIDPSYAPAWGALAQAHALHRYYGGDHYESLERAERAARRALEIDASLGTAHVALADVQRDRHEWSAAERSYRHALELSPDDVEANLQYAQLLARVGHFPRALPFIRRAAELDPIAALPNAFYGYYLFQVGQTEAGLQQIERARQFDPELNITSQAHVTMLIDSGRLAEATAEQERIDRWILRADPNFPYARLHELLRRGADAAAIRAYLRVGAGLSRWSAITHWHWAVHIGAPEIALGHLLAEHDAGARVDLSWAWATALAPVRGLPGFTRLVETLGLPGYWREHGWPEQCRPLTGGGVQCE
jgi:TolB-like protein